MRGLRYADAFVCVVHSGNNFIVEGERLAVSIVVYVKQKRILRNLVVHKIVRSYAHVALRIVLNGKHIQFFNSIHKLAGQPIIQRIVVLKGFPYGNRLVRAQRQIGIFRRCRYVNGFAVLQLLLCICRFIQMKSAYASVYALVKRLLCG